ncbi:MAG: HAD family hydrolase [Balneolaceae bacterium]
MNPILLYDIDGTLLQVHSDFLRQEIVSILKGLGVVPPVAARQSFAGQTDRGIFMELIGDRTDRETLFKAFKQRYIEAMSERLTPQRVDPFRPAIESVHKARERGFEVGLCTGNFREVAMLKVAAVGLDGIFTFGGFGCHHADRNHLPALAHAEYVTRYNRKPDPEHYVVIGDTPNDIRCARHFGARVAAVGTGGIPLETLGAQEPDWLLPDMSSAEQWLDLL